MDIPCCNCGKIFKKCASHAKRQKRNFCCKLCWQNHDSFPHKNFFNNLDSEEKTYWLGFICADGWLDERDKAVGISLSKKDKQHLKKFADLLGIEIKDYVNNTSYGIVNQSRIMIYSKTIFNDLIKKEVTPRKTHKDNIAVFNYIPNNLLNHFIRGWFDGDGSVGLSKTGYGFLNISGTFNVLSTIGLILNRTIGTSLLTPYPDKSIYSLKIGGNDQLLQLKTWLYQNATIFLERKKDKFDLIKCNLVRKGTSKYRGVSCP